MRDYILSFTFLTMILAGYTALVLMSSRVDERAHTRTAQQSEAERDPSSLNSTLQQTAPTAGMLVTPN